MTGVVASVDQRTDPLPMADKLTTGLVQVKVAEGGMVLSEGVRVLLDIVIVLVAVQPLLLVKVTE